MNKHKALAYALFTVSLATAPCGAAYVVTNLGSVDSTVAQPLRINDYGQIVGDTAGNTTGVSPSTFLWQPSSPNATTGSIGVVATPNGSNGAASDINASGQITGYSATGPNVGLAFLFTPSAPNSTSGSAVMLATTPLVPSQQNFFAGINDAGEVVTNNGAISHSALFVPNLPNGSIGAVTDAGGFYGGMKINNGGQFTGNQPNHGGTYQMARFDPTPSGGTTGVVVNIADPGQGGTPFTGPGAGFAINNSGVVAGYGSHSLVDNAFHALLWKPNGTVTDLNPLLGSSYAEVFGLNDAGMAVGYDNSTASGFLYDGSGVAFVDSLAPDPQWHFISATSINNRGQIVGEGYFNGTLTGFLLTPAVPEPTSLTLLAAGASLLMAHRRRHVFAS